MQHTHWARPTLDQSATVRGDQSTIRVDHGSRAGPVIPCPGIGLEKTLGILVEGSQPRLRAECTSAATGFRGSGAGVERTAGSAGSRECLLHAQPRKSLMPRHTGSRKGGW